MSTLRSQLPPLPTGPGYYVIRTPGHLRLAAHVGKTTAELRALGVGGWYEVIVREWEKPEAERSIHPALVGTTWEDWKRAWDAGKGK